MIYDQKPYLDIHHIEDGNIVLMEWKDAPDSDQLKEGLNNGLVCLKAQKAYKWIGDVRKMGAIYEEDQTWSNTVWFPSALQAGIRYMAVLVSKDVFNLLTVEEIMNKVESLNFESRYFDDVESAKEWLKTV